jgi:hypothetical protein
MLSRAKFQLNTSAHLARWSLMVWLALSLCSVGVFGKSWWVLAYMVLAGMVIGHWVWRYAWLKSNTSVVAVSWTPDQCCCVLSNGKQVKGRIMAKSAFNPHLISLHLAVTGGGSFWWPLMADSGPVDGLRKLRVFGRWTNQKPIANQS